MTTAASPAARPAAQTTDRLVDHSALRTNQALIISFLVLGFVLNAWILVAFVAAVMLIGTLFPKAGLFKLVYFRVLKPAGIVKPDVKRDNPEPHQFAQLLGGIFNAVATAALVLSVPVLGWALAWIVVALAALNLFAGICVGCLIYYQLSRYKVPGFTRSPIGS